jgi:transposase
MEWTVAIGIDTHKDTHTAVALDRLGAQVGSCEIETTRSGYLRLLRFAQALGEPAFAIEGAGSYGAGLASLLLASGFPVYEVERPRRRERRQGKSDLLDAARAAGRLLSGDGLSLVRGGGQAREDLRLLLLERRSALRAQTAALNQLHSVLVTGPAELRERLAGLSGEALARRCLRLRPSANSKQILISVLRRLATRW